MFTPDLERIKSKIVYVFKNYAVDLAYLYGSFASNSASKFSDLDIAVVVSRNIPEEQYLDMEMELEVRLGEVLGFENIDARIINSAPLGVKGQVLEKGILLYSRDEDIRVDFESNTRLCYFDFLPVINGMREYFFQHLKEVGLSGK